jgi:pimeloyl-ACP methyl ester carboxylesterase
MTGILPKSVVFITGAFIGNNCWDEWKSYFESRGYTCIAPAWPYKDASSEELRNRAEDDVIASITLTSLIDHFASIISGLSEKPILVGHSLGGLLVQLLLQDELGVAGVAIHSFPPQGVNRFWLSFLKAAWETMQLFSSEKQTYLITFNKWRYTIANGIGYDQQKELYYLYAVPESKRIIREAFKCRAKMYFKKLHVPLLFISGGNDKLISASLNYTNYKRYGMRSFSTEYIEFKAHTHLVFGVPAWREEAGAVLQWLHSLKIKSVPKSL